MVAINTPATGFLHNLEGWAGKMPTLLGGYGKNLGRGRENAEQWVKARPEIALGIAFATGVLLGWLVKRR